MRPLMMWQMCSNEMSRNSMDYPRRLSLIWMQSSWKILGISLQVAEHQTENINTLPPPNWWTNTKNQPCTGRLPTKLCQLWSERLVSTVVISQTCIQQLSYQCTWNVTLLSKLRYPSANRMDEGTRSAEPRGSAIRPLDANNPCSGARRVRTNTRKHEQILWSKSQATTGH